MAIYDIIPNEVEFDDVRDTLNFSGGSVNNDYDSAFAEAANINKWSKKKPVYYDEVIDPSSIDPNWWNGKPVNGDPTKVTIGGMLFGTAYPALYGNIQDVVQENGVTKIYDDTTGFLYKLAKDLTGMWEYVRPTSFFRLGDFRGYAKNAINPNPVPVTDVYKYTSAGAVNIRFDIPTQVIGGILLQDLRVPANIDNTTPLLSSLYVGMLIYNDSLSDVMFATQTEEQKSKGINAITLLNNDKLTVTGKRGEYKARTFYSTKIVELNNFTTPQPIILFPCGTEGKSIFLVDSSLGDIYIEVSGKYIDQTASKYRATCIIYNNTASEANVTMVKFTMSDITGTIKYGNTDSIEPLGQFTSTADFTFPELPIAVEAVVDGKTYYGTIN